MSAETLTAEERAQCNPRGVRIVDKLLRLHDAALARAEMQEELKVIALRGEQAALARIVYLDNRRGQLVANIAQAMAELEGARPHDLPTDAEARIDEALAILKGERT